MVDSWLTHINSLRIHALLEKDSEKIRQRNSFCDKTFPVGAKTSDHLSKQAAEVTCTVR